MFVGAICIFIWLRSSGLLARFGNAVVFVIDGVAGYGMERLMAAISRIIELLVFWLLMSLMIISYFGVYVAMYVAMSVVYNSVLGPLNFPSILKI